MKREDWSFHEIPANELPAAWEWEIERTTARTGQPWVTLNQAARTLFADYCRVTSVREIEIERCSKEYFQLHDDAHSYSSSQLHVFEIRWEEGQAKILKAFQHWLYSTPSWKLNYFCIPDKGGRKVSPFDRLINLAIYRADRAGLKRLEAIKRLEPLLLKGGIQFKQDGSKVGQKHWRATCSLTNREIEARRQRPRLKSILPELFPQ